MDTREEPCSVTNMQRLYVGGLSHTVNERELKERFGKFGAVHDVELRTRKDDDGVPYKTFGYISMNISEGHLKKCMTVLNKSKWKGGTLQIEVAKESFLHKFAQERQTEEERRLQKPEVVDKRQKMLEALSSVGVNNFVMKAAVPGTEIEGHEDWVVSKFGRVLPVLQLGSPKGNGRGSFKYDPSKYCHNIRKLDTATEDSSTPVSKLTWEVRGGDDDISKKRRGEFPPYVPPRPKKKAKVIPDANLITPARPTNGFRPETKPMSSQSRVENWLDSDSEGEIRRIVESQAKSNGGGMRDEQDDEMEVVGLDYLVKSKEKNLQIRDKPADGDDYDSADTDELIASKKPPSSKRQPVPPAAKDSKSVQRKGKQKRNPPDENKEQKEELVCKSRRKASTDQPSGKTTNGILMAKSSESKSEEDESDSSDSASVSDYEAMFSNVTRLEISMTDLQKLAEESQRPSETPGPSSLDNVSFTPTKEPKTPKKDTTPEDILASLMGGGFDNEKEMKTTTGRKSLPPFMGTKMLNDQVEEQTVDSGLVSQDMSPTERIKEGTNEKRVVNEKQNKTLESSQLTDEKMEEEGKSRVGKKEEDVKKCKLMKTNIALKSIPKNNLTNMESIGRSSSSSSDEDDDEDEGTTQKLVKTSGAEVKASSSAHKESPLTKVASKKSGPSCSQSKSSSSEDDDDDDEEETMQTSGAKVKASSSAVKASPLTKVASKKSGPSCDRNKSSSSEEDEDEGTTQKLVKTSAAKVKASSSAVKASPLTKVASNKSGPSCSQRESSSSEEDDDDDEEEEERKKEVQVKPRTPRAAAEEKELQRKANLRRLAAVQQRQKEAEEHKKLIQGALAKLDAPTKKGGKHIVFGSDEDDDDEEEEGETKSRKTLLQDSSSEDESEAKKGKEKQTQLFSSSDDEEEDDDDANKEEKRFEIKPQFEGEAGKKLMELQSRFGTDERFRMNSRFLEEEEEKDGDEEAESEKQTNDESLTDEKKKNLSILQSVLGVDQAYSKPAAKAKTFRDVSALHYDPSREEHAVFEAKPEEKKKESKASRKKKREEAQKLPEVSKDIYFDVSGDLKSVFGFEKDKEVTAKEKGSWDQQEEAPAPAVEEQEEEEQQEEEEPQLSVADAEEKESGFKFSFFGDDAEEECAEEVEYKVEKISASKVSWQQDPRLQDSSSEEEEDEEDKQEVASTTITTETETASTQELFFFFPDDIRLTEGPRCFCRPPQLEEKMEEWEEKRGLLRQEYRKKHKDAKRQLKINNRS